MVNQGIHDPDSDVTKGRSLHGPTKNSDPQGAFDGGTELTVDMDVLPEYEGFFADTYSQCPGSRQTPAVKHWGDQPLDHRVNQSPRQASVGQSPSAEQGLNPPAERAPVLRTHPSAPKRTPKPSTEVTSADTQPTSLARFNSDMMPRGHQLREGQSQVPPIRGSHTTVNQMDRTPFHDLLAYQPSAEEPTDNLE